MSKIVAAAIESSAAMTLRTNSTDRVTVTNGGLVGVGTTTPSVGLEVVGSIRPTGGAVDYPVQVSGNAILVGGAGTPDSGRLIIGDNTGWKWKISNRTGSATTDLVTFTDQGSVGIGVASPTQALDVAGSIKASTSLVLGTAAMATPSGSAPIFGARALVVFDTDRVATSGTAETTLTNTARYIRYSGNVASVTRIGAGLYTIAFTTAMPNADYVVICSVANNINNISSQAALSAGAIGTASTVTQTAPPLNPYNKTTTGFTIHTGSTSSGSRNDPVGNPVSVVVFA